MCFLFYDIPKIVMHSITYLSHTSHTDMCVPMYTNTYVDAYVYVYVHVCTGMHVDIFMYGCVYVFIHACVRTCALTDV